MRNCLIYIYFFVVPVFVFSAESQIARQARWGEVYGEARDYGEARKAYETALDETAEGWQQVAIRYNMGNTMLLSGQIGEALQEYHSASQQALFPELAARISINRAVAQIVRAQGEAKGKEGGDSTMAPVDMRLWREAAEAVSDAQRILCRRNKTLGATNCPPMTDVVALKRIAQGGLAASIDRVEAIREKNMRPEEGVSALQIGIAGLTELLRVMSPLDIKEKITQDYQRLFVTSAEAWAPLWEEMEKATTTPSVEFGQAREAFGQASQQVSSGDFASARQSLELSSRSLQTVIDLLYEGKDIAEFLRILLSEFTHVSSRRSLDKNFMLITLRQMNEMGKQVQEKEPIAEPYRYLTGLNKEAFDLLEAGDDTAALLLIQGAEITTRQLLSQVSPRQETPKDFLQNIIQMQSSLLGMNRAYEGYRGEHSAQIATLLAQLQGKILEQAQQFPAVMKLEEHEQWKRGTFSDLESNWEDISAHFDAGYSAAGEAHEILQNSTLPAKSSTSLQIVAFDEWMSALALLEKMKSLENDLASKPQTSNKAPATSTLMQQLEAMEQDDKSLPPSAEEIKPEHVERPW